MSATALSTGPQTLAARVRSIQQEAQLLVNGSVSELENHVLALAASAAEIADGGDIYPSGIREEARQIMEYNEHAANRLQRLRQLLAKK